MTIKAIETRYKGYRFRSRLEARWAVFFDALGVEWQYEVEGYEVDGKRYLPDFWLPSWVPSCKQDGWGYWVEIKPYQLDDGQIDLLCNLARLSGHHTYALCGEPWPARHTVYSFEHHHHGIPDPKFCIGSLFESVRRIEIPAARIDDTSVEIVIKCPNKLEPSCFQSYELMNQTPGILQKSFVAARSARFEHGECPR